MLLVFHARRRRRVISLSLFSLQTTLPTQKIHRQTFWEERCFSCFQGMGRERQEKREKVRDRIKSKETKGKRQACIEGEGNTTWRKQEGRKEGKNHTSKELTRCPKFTDWKWFMIWNNYHDSIITQCDYYQPLESLCECVCESVVFRVIFDSYSTEVSIRVLLQETRPRMQKLWELGSFHVPSDITWDTT